MLAAGGQRGTWLSAAGAHGALPARGLQHSCRKPQLWEPCTWGAVSLSRHASLWVVETLGNVATLPGVRGSYTRECGCATCGHLLLGLVIQFKAGSIQLLKPNL